jgi:uncharacterized protein
MLPKIRIFMIWLFFSYRKRLFVKKTFKTEIRIKDNDSRMHAILDSIQSLKEYRPPIWGRNPFLQILWLVLRELYYENRVLYDRTHLSCSDGGTLCVDIARDSLDEEAPLVLFLPSITGSSKTLNSFVLTAQKRGWRAVVLNRRGHEYPLTSSCFNLMGDVDDTVAMVNFVRKQFPKSKFIGGVGISAGSGQIVSYIGRESERVGISAAVSLCPAYDISIAFSHLDQKFPRMSNLLLKRIKEYFLQANRDLLENKKNYNISLKSKNLQELMKNVSTFSGAESWEEYLVHHNPMSHFQKNEIPCLILNSLDDPVCVKENIPDLKVNHYALVLSEYGSHIAFAEGFLGLGSWMEQITFDFLDSSFKRESKKIGREK